MNIITRTTDAITNASDLKNLHTIKNFPILMSCVDTDNDTDIVSDLIWQISPSSGLIQLKELIPLDILYREQHSGTTGGLWLKHHQSFSKFLQKYKPKAVLEIGGGHGILSTDYVRYDSIPWTIVEPSPAPVDGCPANIIVSLFDEHFEFQGDFDTVVHSHVFEHLYQPNVFVKHLADIMKDGNQLIFTLPNMEKMLKNNQTNCINFEHTVFLTEPYVEYLLAKHGFRIIEKEYFTDCHSIFYATVKDSTVVPIELSKELYNTNKQIYIDYINYHNKLINDLNNKVQEINGPVYLFGAHIFSQYLLVCGLDGSKIASILDNDPKKQSKRLYGTDLKVESPNILKDIKNPIVILKAGFYNEEIKADILSNINANTIFLE